ncbi:MAG TPA: FG-GAP-like repeat-containing protein [Fimbriiglobus sp.]|nr:FG-GAP-like repeat-containing protein [Fimbriiglobus sp.]
MWSSSQRRGPHSTVRPAIERLEDRALPSGGLSFSDPVDYAVGRSPRSVVAADWNGDRLPDLAVANAGANSVSAFLGNGDGTLRSASTVAVGTSPMHLATADFNGDAVLDLAVANGGSGTVGVLLGAGDGTFTAAGTFAVGTGPSAVAVGDLNGDGQADLAVSRSATNAVSVLPGQGDGSFGPATSIATGGTAGANSVAVADFDRDGRLDLVVANRGPFPNYAAPGTISILRGDGSGQFGTPLTLGAGANPVSVIAADLNGDGVVDAATANLESDSVSVLVGNGDGTLAAARQYSVGRAESLGVGDFNGDGTLDLVTANRHAFVTVLPGAGDGTFSAPCDYWAGAEPVSVAVGDFDGDARPDLAVAQLYSDQLSVLLNDGPQPDDGVTVVRNVGYTDGSPINPDKQNLDLYLPAGRTDFPVVFLAYGGQFRNGDKARLAYLARTLAREGLGVVAVNYQQTDRTPEQVIHPGHVEDVARAFAWTYRHIGGYGGDPGQIILMGHSGGATLVSLLATDRRYLDAHGLSPDLVRGVIGVSGGTYDLTRLTGFEDVFGTVEQQRAASPLTYVDGTQPPYLVLYAQFDNPGFAQDSTAFYQSLVAVGSAAELHMIPDRNHAGIIGRSARPGDPARELILSFIARYTSWDLARVESVQVNDGSAQRSMVKSLTVTFDRLVTIDPGAFEVRRQDGSLLGLDVATSVVNGRTVAVLTFTGPDIVGGSLEDGSYTWFVRSDCVHDRWGRSLDGDADGAAGGDRSDCFHRLYGDSDGDRDVDLCDLARFLGTLGRRPRDSHYLTYFDFNGDNRIGVVDLVAFARRLGTHLDS